MKNVLFLFLIISGILWSCQRDKVNTKTYEIIGAAQKGPYIIGTNITISELESDLTPTGKNFHSTISDNYGSYRIPDVEFSSNYAKLMADGTYYNEVGGWTTSKRLTLTSIGNLNDSSTVNINILTHLESDRLQFLIKNAGMTFAEAKAKTKNEILAIFSLDNEINSNFEYLDITKKGDDNAKLLAISSIIQGNDSRSQN